MGGHLEVSAVAVKEPQSIRRSEKIESSGGSPVWLLERFHALSAWSFWPLTFLIGNLLTLSKLLKSHTHDLRRVKKQVLLAARVNKSEAFVRQFFNRSLWHA
jgi:hypothetical protein